MTDAKRELFEKKPVFISVITLVLPTVLSQIVNIIYNVAGICFIVFLKKLKKYD